MFQGLKVSFCFDAGISGSTRKCETDTIDEAWPGGYKGSISFSAPSDYSSVSLDVQFIHSVATFQVK